MRLHLTGMTVRSPRTAQALQALTAAGITDPMAHRLVASVTLPAGEIPWEGLICVEGVQTGDERILTEGSLTWAALPLPFTDNHDADEILGRMEDITRQGNLIYGAGVFSDDDAGREAAVEVALGMRNGLSVDMDDVEGEIVIEQAHDPAGGPVDATDPEIVIPIGGDLFRVTKARIRGVALCTFAAFVECQVRLRDVPVTMNAPQLATPVDSPPEAIAASAFVVTALDSNGEPTEGEDRLLIEEALPVVPFVALVASITPPDVPPREWFDDPALERITRLTVTDDGRVFGHIAAWGECHIARKDVCVTPPASKTDYAYFHKGETETTDGRVRTGAITAGIGHYNNLSGGVTETIAHYDDTRYGAADVRCGEDEFGIWVAGAVRPEATATQIRWLLASGASGDWRPIRELGGNHELISVLSVNAPGFPIAASAFGEEWMPRTTPAEDGHCGAIVAAGAAAVLLADPIPDPQSEVETRLARLEAIVAPLVPQAAEALLASIRDIPRH